MAANRPQRASFFRPGEFPRLLAMVGMLGVMGLFIFQLRDSSMLHWLTRETEQPEEAVADTPPAKRPSLKKAAPVVLAQADPRQPPIEVAPAIPESPAATPKEPALVQPADQPAAEQPEPVQPAVENPKEPEIVAGTDLDPEEVAEFQKDVIPVTDGLLEIPGVEAKPYARLFRWVDNQPLAALKSRAKKAQAFREYAQKGTAEDHRGELVWLDLMILQITPVDVSDNPVMAASGIERVYEIWGCTKQSQKFLYCCVTAHLPPGLKTGIVRERGRFYGYYFKVLGYKPGQDEPNTRPTPAPLFVGRLDWQPPKVVAPAEEDSHELLIGGAVLGLALCAWILYRVLNRNRASPISGALPTPEASAAGFAQFLERGGETDAAGDNSTAYNVQPNGHSAHGTGLPYSDQSEA